MPFVAFSDHRTRGNIECSRERGGAVTNVGMRAPFRDTGRQGQDGLFAFSRKAPVDPVLCIYNFTEDWRSVGTDWAAERGAARFHDALSDSAVATGNNRIALPPYARVWLL